MSISELLQNWVSASDIRTQEVLGMQVLWWGRLGKLLQGLAVLLGAIEIVGAQRLFVFFSGVKNIDAFAERLVEYAFPALAVLLGMR
jgi:hypothetical protein